MLVKITSIACIAAGVSTLSYSAEHEFIEEMVVIAHPLSSEGLAQPTTVLEGEELSRALAGTLGETLVNQPGIHSSSFGQAVGRPVIRGLGGARVRIMEDRIDAMDVSSSSPDHASTIEPFVADRIEVLKGPSTLLYGSGAIGGVVDVHTSRIPHRVPDRVTGKVELRQADNADRQSAAGVLEAGAGRFVAHLDGFYRRADDYQIPGFARSDALRALDPVPEDEDSADILPGSDLETRGAAGGGSFVTDRGFIGAAISRYQSDYGLPGGADEAGSPTLSLKQTRVDLEAAVAEPFKGAENLNFRVGFNDYQHVEIEPSGEPGTMFDNQALEARLEVLHEQFLGATGALGIQLSAREYAAIGEEAFVPPVDSTYTGLFYVGERSFSQLDLEAGLRYERATHDPQTGSNRNYDLGAVSLGAVAPFDNGWTLSGQLDYSTRAPTVEELFSNGPHLATRSFALGDLQLAKERAGNVSATLQYDGERLRLGASIYYTDFQDFIYDAPNGQTIDELPVVEWRQADAVFRGLDLEADVVLSRWSQGELSVRGFYDQVRGRLDDGDRQNLPRIPPERWGLGLKLNWVYLTATLDYSHSGAQKNVAQFELPTDSFNDLSAYAGLIFPLNNSQLEVFVAGRNLTDDEQRHHASFIKDYAPQPGRTIEGGLRFTL